VAAVHLGYFENFKSTDTVLVEGDAEGLRHLVEVLRSLEGGSAAVVEIDALPFVKNNHGVRLSARRSHRDLVARVGPSSTEFTWERTETGWRDAADLVEGLLGHDAGHQYLDVADDQIVVEISKGEYGSEWWRRHG
jgi:hypothetical protein